MSTSSTNIEAYPKSLFNPRTVYEPPNETNIPGVIYLPNGPVIDESPLDSCQLFDNLYFIGNKFVGTLIIDTGDGLVMIDTMHNSEEVEKTILPGLKTLGLNPANITSIFVTHGHFDHFGGAKRLQQISGCKVIMSKVDAEFMRTNPLPPDKPDIVCEFPDVTDFVDNDCKIKIGNIEFTVVYTPGHTPGGLSLIFPVKDGSNTHLLGLWGGTGSPRAYDAAKKYLESAEHFAEICEKAGVDVEFSAHPFVDYSIEKMEKIRNRSEGESNTFVIGQKRYMLFMYCIMANAISKLEEWEKFNKTKS